LPASRETNRTPNTINKRRTIAAFTKELTTGTTPTAPAPRHSRRAVQFFFWTLALTARGRLRARHVDKFLLAGNRETMSVFGRLAGKLGFFAECGGTQRDFHFGWVARKLHRVR
jgi:hypothetical protein